MKIALKILLLIIVVFAMFTIVAFVIKASNEETRAGASQVVESAETVSADFLLYAQAQEFDEAVGLLTREAFQIGYLQKENDVDSLKTRFDNQQALVIQKANVLNSPAFWIYMAGWSRRAIGATMR